LGGAGLSVHFGSDFLVVDRVEMLKVFACLFAFLPVCLLIVIRIFHGLFLDMRTMLRFPAVFCKKMAFS
jgi:hypothetical protein